MSSRTKGRKELPVIGWREWAALPGLGVAAIKVKVDTGARSSALHAFGFQTREDLLGDRITFEIHPVQRSTAGKVVASAEVVDLRWVRSSSGTSSLRPVIRTFLRLGPHRFDIELTLVRRDVMGFRMLLGRQALRRRFLVDPARSFLLGRPGVGGRPSSTKEEA